MKFAVDVFDDAVTHEIDRDLEGAIALYREAAKLGHAPASFKLATLFESLGESEQSTQWMRTAAEQGHPTAAYLAAVNAIRSATDESKARPWLELAAGEGLPEANLWLGHLALGRQELAEAWAQYELAAADRCPEAFIALAKMAHDGTGQEASHEMFLRYLERAEAAGAVGIVEERGRRELACETCREEVRETSRRIEVLQATHFPYGDQWIPFEEVDLNHYQGTDPGLVAEDMRLRPYFVCANDSCGRHLGRKDQLRFNPKYLGYRRTRCEPCYERERKEYL